MTSPLPTLPFTYTRPDKRTPEIPWYCGSENILSPFLSPSPLCLLDSLSFSHSLLFPTSTFNLLRFPSLRTSRLVDAIHKRDQWVTGSMRKQRFPASSLCPLTPTAISGKGTPYLSLAPPYTTLPSLFFPSPGKCRGA